MTNDRDENYTWTECARDLALATPLTFTQAGQVANNIEGSGIHPYDALPHLKNLFGVADTALQATGLLGLICLGEDRGTRKRPRDDGSNLTKEHLEAILAMITAMMNATTTGDHAMDLLKVIAKPINEIAPAQLALTFGHIVQLLLQQLALVQGRPAEEVWQEISLVYAQSWPDEKKAP